MFKVGFLSQHARKNMPEPSRLFASRLKSLREAAGISQYALAKRSGLSKQGISRLELGEHEPIWNTVQVLAAALGVSCEAFSDPAISSRPKSVEQPRAPGRPRKVQDSSPPATSKQPGRVRKKAV